MTVWVLAPCRAAPVRMRPKIGPAQGAQSSPVPIPSKKEFRTLGPESEFCESRLPSCTSGRDRRSASDEKSKVRPNTRKEDQGGDTAELVGPYRPTSAHRRQAGNQSKRDRHTGKQRQTALAEGLIGAREHERQHRQDAGAENGEHPAEIR